MEIDDNIDRLAEIIEIKHKDLVDNMKLVSALISNGRASDIVTYTKDAWEIYDNAMELRGMITAYKIILDISAYKTAIGIADVKPEIRDIEEDILCYHDTLKRNLKKVAIKYVESERDFRKWGIVSGQK